MKTYILTGRQGEYDDTRIFIVAVSRDRMKVEQVKAQKETIETYKKIQHEIYDKTYEMYRELERQFYNQNPQPELYNGSVKNEQDWDKHNEKHDAFFLVAWGESLNTVLKQYGVQRNFMPEGTEFPDELIKYSISEWEEL